MLYVSNRGRNGSNYYLPGPEWGSDSDRYPDRTNPRRHRRRHAADRLDVSPDGRAVVYSDFLDDRMTLYAIPPYPTLAAGHGGRSDQPAADLPKKYPRPNQSPSQRTHLPPRGTRWVSLDAAGSGADADLPGGGRCRALSS